MALGIILISGSLDPLDRVSPPEEWHRVLLLPENYEVLGAKMLPGSHGEKAVIVKSDAIPEHPSGLTEVMPVYKSVLDDEEGIKYHPELDRIEFEAPLTGETKQVDLLTAKMRDLANVKKHLTGEANVSP